MSHSKLTPYEIGKLRDEAWIGDAVLELYARSWVLREKHVRDIDSKVAFTRNSFLNCFDQPTRVEAKIGVIYSEAGLEAAFAWIKEKIEPLFLKQQAKRKRSQH